MPTLKDAPPEQPTPPKGAGDFASSARASRMLLRLLRAAPRWAARSKWPWTNS